MSSKADQPAPPIVTPETPSRTAGVAGSANGRKTFSDASGTPRPSRIAWISTGRSGASLRHWKWRMVMPSFYTKKPLVRERRSCPRRDARDEWHVVGGFRRRRQGRVGADGRGRGGRRREIGRMQDE